eukprot:7987154-Lingulodinium_polyedra.AAC.1
MYRAAKDYSGDDIPEKSEETKAGTNTKVWRTFPITRLASGDDIPEKSEETKTDTNTNVWRTFPITRLAH